ncbi:SWI/SNF-related matrix-associated actin-dependent regulator of chromatin subfamily A containing DEAD/H box 1 homolog [Coccinella septempunctata]|uniref:SWI/SNF-related matrix-associated actin-dependent regulator of chromatin subfamily A containing DEAD/H box 1 homolog n=1 Tax=Coccinella septempunctata TaxID=41139 RepID=UPI001D08B268|nr:SWI/SNF-related matrix-associated actin-dependent regulator of chromatin subfamily A containing DEAD/H box 1 homolog [Coccinella septempunctata]
MSDDNGSQLNLRGFRINKKAFSHEPISTSSSSMNGNSTVSSANSSAPKRKRILILPTDSDSESDSNDTSQSVSSSATVESSSRHQNLIIVKNGVRRTMKTPSILEKERQMKYLLELFPHLEAMVVHDMLSKYNFNTDEAAAELSRLHGKEVTEGGYANWKLEYQQRVIESNVSSVPREEIRRNFKRQAAGKHQSDRKRVKKRRTEDDDTDDSTGAADYNDQRVYNSDEDTDTELSDELMGDKKNVFDFLQNATLTELQLMNSCSKKKAEALMESRPFNGWIDLVEKLEKNKNLSTDLLNSAQQVLYVRNNIKNLMKKCTNIATSMERAVAAGAGVKEQPRNLSSALKLTSYQMVGLNWLAVLHSQGVNGILADEMGLGKTVQVISFLAYLKETGQAQDTHLVVVPASTLDNWRNEFARWCPELRVFMYYGSIEERKVFRIEFAQGVLEEFDVVLTTYTTVANTPEERKMFKVIPMHYVIFDEAHMLKNMNTQRYENLIRINAKHRILLTGTPLQNNLLELMSLLIFVMPKMFAEKTTDIKSLFQKGSKSNQGDGDLPTFEKEQIEKAKRIMKPFVLRRLKQDVLKDLPTKTDHVIPVPMAPTQKEQYESLVASYQAANIERKENDEVPLNSMTMMTDLRKLSNHPLLLRYHYDYTQVEEIAKRLAKDPGYKDTKEEYIIDDLLCMSDFDIYSLIKNFACLDDYDLPENLILCSGKFLFLDKLLADLKQGGHRVLIFSQYVIMLNIMEEYMKLRKHEYCRLDGSTPVSLRQELINEFNDNKDIFVFLLSTKAGGLGINLTAADTVVIHDIDFNPYNDKQAEDRCHRMGQTRPVTVYRLISQGTIEEGMLEMNKEKLKLERQITDDGDNPDVKSVVRLLSSALGVESSKLAHNSMKKTGI